MSTETRPGRNESILLLGLGGVGFYLAQRLSREGYAITAIEKDPAKVRRADGEIDARLIVGNALSFDSWHEAEASKSDYLIAVTSNDAINLFGCRLAAKLGVRTKIARLRNVALWSPGAMLDAADLHIDSVIRPAEVTAQRIARLLQMRTGDVRIDVGEGEMQVIAIRVTDGSELDGASLRDLASRYDSFDFRVVAISRGIHTLIPGGHHKLLPDDRVFILARAESMEELAKLAGVGKREKHRVMIVGGGRVGRRVAELIQDVYPVTLLEQDAQRAEALSHRLTRTTVLHGDASDPRTLALAGLERMDEIVTATGDNETNVMTGVLAKHIFRSRRAASEGGEAGKTVVLVYREDYQVLASTMGADVVLNPKVIAGNRILEYVRRGSLLSVAHLHGCEAEVVEIVAEPGSPITRRPLAELGGLAGRILIGGVLDGGAWQVAVGSTHIAPGQRTVAICDSATLPELQGLFRA